MFSDAERYQKLRGNHWNDGPETLIVVRSKDLKVGTTTYTGEMLDRALDESMDIDIAEVIDLWLKQGAEKTPYEKSKLLSNIIFQLYEE